MPMFPGPTAAITFAAIKFGGYTAFAHVLTAKTSVKVDPLPFGIAKTTAGFLTNLLSLPLYGALASDVTPSVALVLTVLVPIRWITWLAVLRVCTRQNALRPQWLPGVAAAGVAWSFSLDAAMWLFSQAFSWFPGMTMPVC